MRFELGFGVLNLLERIVLQSYPDIEATRNVDTPYPNASGLEKNFYSVTICTISKSICYRLRGCLSRGVWTWILG